MKKAIFTGSIVLGTALLVAGCQSEASTVKESSHEVSSIKKDDKSLKEKESELNEMSMALESKESQLKTQESVLNQGEKVAKSTNADKVVTPTESQKSTVTKPEVKKDSETVITTSNAAINALVAHLKGNIKEGTAFLDNGQIEHDKKKGYMINIYQKGSEMPSGSYFVGKDGSISQLW